MTNDNHSEIPPDVDPSAFGDATKVDITLSIPMSMGLWTWVRAKAAYEGVTHEEEIAALILSEYNNASRHAEENGHPPLPLQSDNR